MKQINVFKPFCYNKNSLENIEKALPSNLSSLRLEARKVIFCQR